MNMLREKIPVGDLFIGGDAPVTVQTMWKRPLGETIDDVLASIHDFAAFGCDLIRFSAPRLEDARIIGAIAKRSPIPIVADIHFDHRIALEAIRAGVHKVRINPGNIGSREKAETVLRAAADAGVAIRVGINGGSLPRTLRNHPDRGEAMLLAAEEEIGILEKIGFSRVVFSLKSSDIESSVKANTLFSQRYRYPLHIGLTESGPLVPGTVKSSIMISRLLLMGIGDTIRVSLSEEPIKEVMAGVEILKALGLRKNGVRIISCPRCGRSTFDPHAFLARYEKELLKSDKSLTVAVMGCVVNGPEEARHADIGITGAGREVIVFRKGSIVYKGEAERAYKAFWDQFSSFEG
jgi:(E)-4-hydroxy-3-methylbut-2-enyl-diphosphate synthase